MPRTKRTIRRGAFKGAKLRAHCTKPDPVGPQNPLPHDLILRLRNLAQQNDDSKSSSSNNAQTTKRRKLDIAPPPSIHVAHGEIVVQRLCYDHDEDFVVERPSVGEDILFGISNESLIIQSRKASPSGHTITHISLAPEDLKGQVKNIVRIAGHSPRDVAPGAIWSDVALVLERDGGVMRLKLEFHLFWNETSSPYNGIRISIHKGPSQNIIDTFYPTLIAQVSTRSPMDFYNAAHVPAKDDILPLSIDVPGMDTLLFPYQKRTLQWLLGREGVQWSGSTKGIIPLSTEMPTPVSDGSRSLRDVDNKQFYLSDALHTVTSNLAPYRQAESSVRGGILSEEMGLGKTLEVLGLILLHPRPNADFASVSTDETTPVASGATLIVTPESLRRQWMSEIARHAPGLRVIFYRGCKNSKDEDPDAVTKQLAASDIVLTTYNVLSAEMHFTYDAPERSRRHERVYERAKSPLVQISWWRLCLDEAQMIESGYSQAASVAKTIPRVNAWGVSGTPVKNDVKDLYGLLLFLHYEPLCSAPQAWGALLSGHLTHIFHSLFNTISLRHTKALVRDEILLPPQKRYVISVPFTAVEEQHYQTIFKEMAEACNLDAEGNPTVDDWLPENHEESMRVWLNRLRQTALHPEVGVYSRRVLGSNKARPMRTVEEVLDAMLEQSFYAIRTDQRTYLAAKLARGQLYENGPRVKEALSIWEEVRDETRKWMEESKKELNEAIREARDGISSGDAPSEDSSGSQDSDDDDGDEAETKGRIGECRRRFRSALELHHKAVFFCANANFQIRDNAEMTEPESEEWQRVKKLEDIGYEEAKVLRRKLLQEAHTRASRLMGKLSKKASAQTFIEIPELAILEGSSLESARITDGLEVLYEELNAQANVIDEWREAVVQLLMKNLFDEDDAVETTGEELGEAAKIQDELMVYVQVLRTAIADRLDAMTGQTNELVKHEAITSIKMARDGEGPAPEKLLELMEQRDVVKPKESMTSMRGAISDFRGVISRLGHEQNQTGRVVGEQRIASMHLQATQATLLAQAKVATAMESEVENFTATMNARLAYYSSLQSLSDSVLPYEGARTEDAVARMVKAEEDLRRKLASAEAKHRYLAHLKATGSKSNEPRMCIICQASFETGVLTACGHQFCKGCMMLWFKAHRNCPVCKKHLQVDQMHDITMKPQEIKMHSETHETDGVDANAGRNGEVTKAMIYSEFNADKLDDIKNIELGGPSYTSKVDTLVRHLLWLRESDPGAKSIVFSQYKDFLSVLSTAFERFRIGHASIDSQGGATRFKEDPAVEVFLLHARAHASGLNLVNASHVFLCEPLVNTALELQAIARVDRIGQQHETTVWLYITAGTVEESIYNLSVKRRMEHMGESKLNGKGKSKESTTPELLDASLEAANTLELEHAALNKLMSRDKTAGEVVDKGDLWECLFGHVDKGVGQRRAIVEGWGVEDE